MNIFILDKDLVKSAQLLCDQHLNKQILELAQIICTVMSLEGATTPYKPTHKHHPVTKWAVHNLLPLAHYHYLLCIEFQYRTGKIHQCLGIPAKLNIPISDLKTFSSPVPIRNDLDLIKEKLEGWLTRVDKRQIIARWTNRATPDWYHELLIKYNINNV